MAKASKHHVGPDAQGKGSGSGALTELDENAVGENMILSNRDKSRHPDSRGLDSKGIENEQHQDQPGNKLSE